MKKIEMEKVIMWQIIGKAAEKIICNPDLKNMVGPVVNTFFPDIINGKDARDNYVKYVLDSDNFSMPEKQLMLLERNKIIKEFKRKITIAQLTDKLLEEEDYDNESSVENINSDIEWFERFFDQAKYIDDEHKQVSWAYILSQKVKAPKEVPISVIRILTEITETQANAFSVVCSQKVVLIQFDEKGKILKSDDLLFVPYLDNKSESNQVSFELLNELERIGLINFSSINGYSTTAEKEAASYAYVYNGEKLGNYMCKGEGIHAGTVFLTQAGMCLEKIVIKTEMKNYLNSIYEYGKAKGILQDNTVSIVKYDL